MLARLLGAGLAVLASTGSLYAQQLQWHLSPVNGHWYARDSTPMNWHQARAIALAAGGELPTIRSAQEDAWITATLTPNGDDFWIGLNRDNSSSTWTWVSGEPVVFLNWGPGEPNNVISCGIEEKWVLSGWTGSQQVWLDVGSTPVGTGPCWLRGAAIELESDDCDENGLPDVYEISQQPTLDTNSNGVLDACEAIAYCTAGTSTNGCTPSMAGVGTPSASQPSGFEIVCSNVETGRSGLIFYGMSPAAVAWAINSTSLVCVAPPQQRTGAQNTGGSGACTGVLSVDFNAYMATHPAALGSPFSAGDTFYAQAWFRDPAAPKHTNLSDGLKITLLP